MNTIAVDKITVGKRHRQDVGDLESLMESIAEHGVLSPISLLPDHRLLCGGRRLEACRRLGLTAIPYHIVNTQDDALRVGRAKTLRDAQGGTVPAALARILTGMHNKKRRLNLLPDWVGSDDRDGSNRP